MRSMKRFELLPVVRAAAGAAADTAAAAAAAVDTAAVHTAHCHSPDTAVAPGQHSKPPTA